MKTEKLLQLLNANNVDYIIIGATAFPIHGYARSTLDIDIFIRPERDNAEKVHKALQEFGYDMTDVTIEDILSKKLLIRQYIVATDVHPFVTGTTFKKVWEHKIRDYYGDTLTVFASLDDLIKMKKAANRPKDQEDLKHLCELKRHPKNDI